MFELGYNSPPDYPAITDVLAGVEYAWATLTGTATGGEVEVPTAPAIAIAATGADSVTLNVSGSSGQSVTVARRVIGSGSVWTVAGNRTGDGQIVIELTKFIPYEMIAYASVGDIVSLPSIPVNVTVGSTVAACQLAIASARAVINSVCSEDVTYDAGDGSESRTIKAIVDRKGATKRFGQKALAAVMTVSVNNDAVTGITPQQAAVSTARLQVATDLGGEPVARRMSIVSQDSGMVELELM